MKPEFFTEFQKTNLDCTLTCFLTFMKKHSPHSPGTHQDRTHSFVTKGLFWWFVDDEFFDKLKMEKSQELLVRMLEGGLTELMLFDDALSKLRLQSRDTQHWLKSTCLTLMAKLNGYLKRLKHPTPLEQFSVGPECQAWLQDSENIQARYIKMVNTKQPYKDVPNFTTLEYQREYFLKFNNEFCQICSIADTLSDSDYFIFCEVP